MLAIRFLLRGSGFIVAPDELFNLAFGRSSYEDRNVYRSSSPKVSTIIFGDNLYKCVLLTKRELSENREGKSEHKKRS